MKKCILILAVLMTACASKPPIAKVPDFEVHAMSRSEVVTAINECESYEMKPFVEYILQRDGIRQSAGPCQCALQSEQEALR